MEEKEKLERGEIVEKKPATTPSERTAATTEEAQQGEVEEQEQEQEQEAGPVERLSIL